MNIRIAGIVNDSIVDGAGIRLTVFTQGCPHHCPGCHNPGTHDPNGGRVVDTDEIIAMMDANPLLDGVTLSGGEPFEQALACSLIAEAAHKRGLNVWCYTGWTYEQLAKQPLLSSIDVLVDGAYVQSKRSLELKYRGSSNQRVIDVRRSLAEGRVVECL